MADKLLNNKRHVFLSEATIDRLLRFFVAHFGQEAVQYFDDPVKYNDILRTDWGELVRPSHRPTLYVYKAGDRANMTVYCTIWCVECVEKSGFTQDAKPERQVQVKVDMTQPERDDVAYMDISGYNAYRKMKSIIKKHYTDDEIHEIVESHKAPETHELHYEYVKDGVCCESNVIYHFKNVFYADINNAHGAALLELYPRCFDEIMEMYKHRKDTIHGVPGYYKKIFNYTVGYFKKVHDIGSAETRNWVVNRTRTALEDFIRQYKGDRGALIYANTDGAMFTSSTLWKPEDDIALGGFKVKRGDVYMCNIVQKGATPYTYLTFIPSDGSTPESKSHISVTLRKQIDLPKGKIVTFNQVMRDGVRVNDNITVKEVPVYEI